MRTVSVCRSPANSGRIDEDWLPEDDLLRCLRKIPVSEEEVVGYGPQRIMDMISEFLMSYFPSFASEPAWWLLVVPNLIMNAGSAVFVLGERAERRGCFSKRLAGFFSGSWSYVPWHFNDGQHGLGVKSYLVLRSTFGGHRTDICLQQITVYLAHVGWLVLALFLPPLF
jgi:hypothetical protein